MKYIIDIPKTVGMTEKVRSVHYTYFDGIQCKTIILKSDEIEELNSDYINEHYGQLQDEAYQRGYKDCETRYCSFDACPNRQGEYRRGLNDAWEAARKIVCDESFDASTLMHIFNRRSGFDSIFGGFSASEAIAKLKAYEEKQNDKIEVGDTVDLKDAVSDKGGGIVTKIFDNDCCYIVWYDGSGGAWAKDMLVKTGKHIDIASILEEMKK